MKSGILILSVMILPFSFFNTYRIANRHVTGKLQKSGLSFLKAELEKYSIAYWDSQNEKPVLIMLQGFGADGKYHWYKQVEEFKNYRIIIPDLLYFGGSAPRSPAFSLVDQVRAMQSLIKYLNIKEFYLCGDSYGGLVAAELALAEPLKVKKLVICDAPIKYFTNEDLQPLFKELNISKPAELLIPKDHKMLKNLLGIAYKNPPMLPLFLFRDMQKNLYSEYVREQQELLARLEKDRGFYESQEYKFRLPVLLIWGEYDRLVPKRVGIELQKHIGANSRLEVIPNTAHMPNWEEPEKFNKVVMEFLETM